MLLFPYNTGLLYGHFLHGAGSELVKNGTEFTQSIRLIK